MPYSKRLIWLVLFLGATTVTFLVYALDWTKSAELSDLPAILTVAGNFHPILLHLPIGVFLYLGFAEAWNFLDRAYFKRNQIKGGLPVLGFGTVTAVLAAFAGLLLYLQGDYSGELINDHMNWGTAFAISSIIVFCCALIFRESSQVYRIILFLSIIVLSVAAHQGGLITHGDPLEPLFKSKEAGAAAKPIEEVTSYEVVDKIFQAKCYDCHSAAKKQKGGLLMDSYVALLAGGKKGDVLIPGSLEESRISTYLHLPLEDEYHMPPEGKPQLTEEEIEFIDAWILAGATPDGLLVEQGLSEQQLNWAVVYMQTAPAQIDADSVEEPEVVEFDLTPLIAEVEQYALNSLSRVGPAGEYLIFSAVNVRNSFNEEGLKALVDLAPYLIDIDLSYTTLSSSAIAELLRLSPQLKRLNMSGTQVDKETIKALIAVESLKSLILFEAQLAPNTIPALSSLNQLEALYLAGTGLTPIQVEQIRQALPGVEVVDDDFLSKHSPKPPEEVKE